MLPKITALFRLAKDPDLRFSPSGMAVCNLYLVASEKYKEKETQLFISATAFSKTAEFIATVTKGQRVYVTGKLQTESWEKDGQRQSKISMIIDSFEYVEKKQDNSTQPAPNQSKPAQTGNTGQQAQDQQGFYQPQQPQQPQNDADGGFTPDSDIPFIQHGRFML